MAQLLGTLASRAAENWKRSLAIVAVVLVALGLAAGAAGGSFVDDLRTPGTESHGGDSLTPWRVFAPQHRSTDLPKTGSGEVSRAMGGGLGPGTIET